MDPNSLLIDNYFNKKIFANPNIENIYEEIRKEAPFSGITKTDVRIFQQSLYELSRAKENRILRGKKRYFSHRQWITYGPGRWTNKAIHTTTHVAGGWAGAEIPICTLKTK